MVLEKLRQIMSDGTIGTILLRAVSLFLLVTALQYWVRLLGVFAGPDYRFDTMAEHWQIASLVMAVGLPVTALGLWVGSSWGIVLWFPFAAGEITMHTGLAKLFGEAPVQVAIQASAVLLYLVYVLIDRILANQTLTRDPSKH